MTIQELYKSIGADYDQAILVMRLDKLLDKHIRKFANNGVVEGLLAAGESMDPTELFEMSHAMKGVCANLGLVDLYSAASEISEEFRPGNDRNMSDEEIKIKLEDIRRKYNQVVEGIRLYEQSDE